MRINKTLQTTLPISPLDLYGQTDELSLLKETYEGICYNGCLILDILKVVQKSMIRIVIDDRSCPGSIDVTFIAVVEEFNPGDIIVAEFIKPLAGNTLLCVTDHCAIKLSISNTVIASLFKPKDKIPVQVKGVDYLIGKSISNSKPISISAIVPTFTPQPSIIVKLKSAPTAAANDYLAIFKQYEAKMAEIDKKKLAEFRACIYPFKRTKNTEFKGRELEAMSVEEGGYYIFPPEFPRTSPKVIELKDEKQYNEKPIIEVSGDIFVVDVLMQCIRYLIVLHDLCHHFEKPSSDKTMMTYWASINNLKSD
jgi:hypothetical protein